MTILPFKQWTTIVSETVVAQYNGLASELLTLQCRHCDEISSQLVAFDANVSSESLFSNGRSEAVVVAFSTNVALFCTGSMSIGDFYDAVVHEYFPALQSTDDEVAWDLFSMILKSIEEPERRCNLQRRYYRDRPCMRTACCNAEHCFQCVVHGFHHGKSCLQVRSAMDNTIVECPTCHISLVKSDGCDSVRCVCGSTLDWEDEVSRIDECRRFLMLHPVQPSTACAHILCTMADKSTLHRPDIQLAIAWTKRHRTEVNRALVAWFRSRFAPCPSQACLTLNEAQQTKGVQLAMALWRAEHAAEVARCQAQRDLAVASLFLTMQPRAADRVRAARRFIDSGAGHLPANRVMKRSVAMWIAAHREEYDALTAES